MEAERSISVDCLQNGTDQVPSILPRVTVAVVSFVTDSTLNSAWFVNNNFHPSSKSKFCCSHVDSDAITLFASPDESCGVFISKPISCSNKDASPHR